MKYIIALRRNEVFKYNDNYILNLHDIDGNEIIKALVIDNNKYSTMMLAGKD